VALQVASGEVLAVLGPNGAGKSTALAALAGLVALDGGRVELGGAVLEDPASGVRVPVARRSLGMVFQEHLLFPHLSVLDNVAFGLRARRVGRPEARSRAAAWLARVGVAEHAQARPRELSGGQAQRAALARALVTDPALLLLDEPLSALDAGTRPVVRSELRRHLTDYPGATLLVTHDALDTMVLADRVVVVESGRVVQQGPPGEVAAYPRTDYVAGLLGLNLLRGSGAGDRVGLDGGGYLVVPRAPPGRVLVAFPPAALTVHRQRPEGSARNVWAGRVRELEQRGDLVRLQLDGPPAVHADVTPGAVAELGLGPGEPVWLALKASEVSCYPA
jgi:molybdate transport system ATP-binding protein